jgi:hypothetical protein
MDGVARSLQTDRPRDPNGIPADAWLALGDAEGAAAGMGTGFPDWFGLYVTQAINGRALEAPAPIDADSPALVKREAPLIAALRLIHVQLVAPRAPEVAEAMLEAAFVLHAKLAQFAEEHSTRLVTERPTES